jgi:hypothetical protein
MRCLRFDLWKKFTPYVDGELSEKTVKRVEEHLLDCNDCRLRLARLRDGQRFARYLPQETPQYNNWEALAIALDADENPAPFVSVPEKESFAWRKVFTSPLLASAMLTIAFLVLGFSLFFNKQKSEFTQAFYADRPFDAKNFRPVTISDIQNNTKTHVVAEGYVTEVHMDEEDGDLMFKLVEDVSQPQPFIVCEIIGSTNVAVPTVGSRVKVYGVSRYDADEGRNWHEVHPVLALEKVHD